MTQTAPGKLIATTVIGSYPQPSWLVDLAKLRDHMVPRVRADDIWQVVESAAILRKEVEE